MALVTHPPSGQLEERVRKILREIPAERFPLPVHAWHVSFGTDATDDEAFFVRAVLDTDKIPHGTLGAMSRTIREAGDASGVLPGAWTYLNLRTVRDPG